MPASDEKLRQFDILLKNFQSIGKTQSFYVNSLAAFLFLVWAIETLHQSGGVTITILGASVQIAGLWQVVPFLSALLVLALAGSINLIAHAYRRLNLCLIEICDEDDFFWVELDPHKNVLDYLGFLTLRLKTPIMPDTTAASKNQRTSWRIPTLLYPALVSVSIGTTLASLAHVQWSLRFLVYVIASVVLQIAFTLPFVLRKLGTFIGLYKSGEDGVDWGTEALYRLPLSKLQKAMGKTTGSE